MNETLLYSVVGTVATITLNRPRVMNALDPETIVRLREACAQARDDASVRCIVLRGNGPAFLAGGDIVLFHANLKRLPAMVKELSHDLNKAIMALRRAAKPVLASVHGAVAGAGISLLAAADLAIAASDTQFTLAYSKIGASPDGGCTWFLPRIIGSRKALELMLLSAPFDADKALALGLVNWVIPAAELAGETDKIAQRLARGPTFAFGETKALVNESFERPLDMQLSIEAQVFARCSGSADFAEGVSAFVEKRESVFTGK